MTTENNKIIAKFMGYIDNGCSEEGFLINPTTNYDEDIIELKFNSDWNCLMDVVEKIESLGYNFNITSQNATALQNHSAIYQTNIYSVDGTKKIQATYETVVEFIKWYNQQKE